MTETGYNPAAITEKLRDMTADEAVKMTRELCAQLRGDADGFHGNIWPDNVRLDWDGRAVLGDPSDEPANRREAEQIEYLAPEFFWDSEGTAATDVYSLALLLYAACSGGYLPFQPKHDPLTPKDRSGALRRRMKGEAVEPPEGVTPELAAVIQKALAYEPEDRYISAAEFLRALSATDEALPAPAAEPTDEAPASGPEADAPDTEEALTAEDAPEDEEEALPTEDEPEAIPAEEAVEEPDAAPAEEEAAQPEKTLEEALSEEVALPDLPAEEPAPIAEDAPAEEAEDEAEAGVLTEDTSLAEPEAVAAEEAPAAEPAPEAPRYTVKKDPKDRAGRASVPAVNRKKKTSPLIPVLCAAAILVIAAAVILLRQQPAPAGPESADSEPITYTIEPTLPTPAPEAVEVTPSLGDDDAAEETAAPVEEADAETETEEAETETGEAETAEAAPIGSALIDGLTVEPAGDVVEIIDTGTNLRTGPSTSYPIAESLPRGVQLIRTGTVNGWSQVHYNDNEYYVASNLVSVVEHPEASALVSAAEYEGVIGTLVVTADVNIRSGPGTDYEKLGTAKTGARLSIIGRSSDGKWYLVSTSDGEGYVNRNLISVRDYAEVSSLSGTLEITGDVNLRSGPGTGYDVLDKAKTGDALTMTGVTDSGWYRVDLDGQTAYLAGEYAKIS